MTALTLPAWFKPDSFTLRPFVNQRSFASPYGGSEQVVDQMNDRWLATLSLPPRITHEAGQLEAFLGAFRGQANTVGLHHFVRPVPTGTLRGAPTLAYPLFQGDPNLILQTVAGATLFAGDLIGCAGMLFLVAQDCVADGGGVLNAPFVNRSRYAAPAGTPVVWDRPSVQFRLLTQPSGVQFLPGYAAGLSLEFAEAIP